MLKINCLHLTVALSFFTIFLYKTDNNLPVKPINHSHGIKVDEPFNTCAISTNNPFLEVLNLDKQKKHNHANYLERQDPLLLLVENNSPYLKICGLFDLNLTVSKIIYPFHCFL